MTQMLSVRVEIVLLQLHPLWTHRCSFGMPVCLQVPARIAMSSFCRRLRPPRLRELGRGGFVQSGLIREGIAVNPAL